MPIHDRLLINNYFLHKIKSVCCAELSCGLIQKLKQWDGTIHSCMQTMQSQFILIWLVQENLSLSRPTFGHAHFWNDHITFLLSIREREVSTDRFVAMAFVSLSVPCGQSFEEHHEQEPQEDHACQHTQCCQTHPLPVPWHSFMFQAGISPFRVTWFAGGVLGLTGNCLGWFANTGGSSKFIFSWCAFSWWTCRDRILNSWTEWWKYLSLLRIY